MGYSTASNKEASLQEGVKTAFGMEVMEKIIKLTSEEGMLIDWVLTMHSYDSNRLEQLERAEFKELRRKIAPVILDSSEEFEVTLQNSEIQYLLITVPITFRFGKEDVGFSLKSKLLAMMTPLKINWYLEKVSDENSNGASPDNAKDSAKDSS